MDIFDYKPGTEISPLSGQSNLTKARLKRLNCDNCGIEIRRPPSQCRGKTIACSPSCRAILRRVRVKSNCAICGKEMEQIPSMVGWVVTCSDACQKMRKAYDVVKNAPRFEAAKQTRSQFCESNGLTRNQFRYRAKTGQSLDANLIHKCKVENPDSGKAWESMSSCAKDIGATVSAVHAAISRGGKCKGVRLIRAPQETPQDNK